MFALLGGFVRARVWAERALGLEPGNCMPRYNIAVDYAKAIDHARQRLGA